MQYLTYVPIYAASLTVLVCIHMPCLTLFSHRDLLSLPSPAFLPVKIYVHFIAFAALKALPTML
jgi:hypothetical protein